MSAIRACSFAIRTASDNYAPEANQLQAKNLKGKLLLAHGTLDNNVPPQNTELVVDALIKANKDFDLLMIPNAGHGYGSRGQLHDAPPLGLLRAVAARQGTACGLRDSDGPGARGGTGPITQRAASSV